MKSTGGKFENVCKILDKHHRDPHQLIAILQELQAEYSYLPEELMTFVATALGIPPAQVYGVATFYSHFTLSPKGKHILRFCDGTACHVKKSTEIIDAVCKELGVSKEHPTTADGMFTVETVACLGACGLAPVMVADEHVHGLMNVEKALAVIAQLKEAEGGAN